MKRNTILVSHCFHRFRHLIKMQELRFPYEDALFGTPDDDSSQLINYRSHTI